ncbi:MAG: hypothetical protein MI746_14155 [Pseudomonadales bacterium]|nr:hypothetical protein [Pseudomonadales bacterium]
MIRRFTTAMILGLCTASAYADSAADGVWNFAMSSQMGSVSATVIMKIDGDQLTGEFDLGNGRKWAIEDGSVDGDKISFNINRDGASMTYVMSATIDGDTVSGTASALGSVVPWSMTRDG